MAVAVKAVSANPIHEGASVFLGPNMGPVSSGGQTLPDSYITDLNNQWDTDFRNRLYYTTGEADPPDPT